jgi:hypothetical protein
MRMIWRSSNGSIMHYVAEYHFTMWVMMRMSRAKAAGMDAE